MRKLWWLPQGKIGDNMIMKKLEVEEHSQTRKLWEEVFAEDTKEFLDYYYQYMTDHNKIYTIEKDEQLVSMIHLNPYQIQLVGKLFPVHYIVGVATKKEYRKQGIMGTLLKKVLHDLQEQKEPITYLMPAAESIYTPYGFVVVGEQVHYEYTGKMRNGMFVDDEQGLTFSYAIEADCQLLEEFANNKFNDKYAVFTRRTTTYFSQLVKEQKCQNGGIVLVKKAEELVGYFITANEGYQQIREIVLKDGISLSVVEKEHINMMARVTCVESFLLCTNWHAGKRYTIQVIDPIITENTGTYRIAPSYGGLKGRKISNEVNEEQAWTIEELTKKVLNYELKEEQVLLNEIV